MHWKYIMCHIRKAKVIYGMRSEGHNTRSQFFLIYVAARPWSAGFWMVWGIVLCNGQAFCVVFCELEWDLEWDLGVVTWDLNLPLVLQRPSCELQMLVAMRYYPMWWKDILCSIEQVKMRYGMGSQSSNTTSQSPLAFLEDMLLAVSCWALWWTIPYSA